LQQVNFKGIILGEKSQVERTNCMILFI
jgi:hypothetical protein